MVVTIISASGETEIFYPWMRLGAGGKTVSNGGAGGIFAGIDTETGVVIGGVTRSIPVGNIGHILTRE